MIEPCEVFEEHLSELLADDAHKLRARWESHVSQCDQCSELAGIHSQLKQMGRKLEIPDPEDFAVVREAVLEETGLSRQAGIGLEARPAWIPVAIAATLMLATFGLGWWTGSGSPRPAASLSPEQTFVRLALSELEVEPERAPYFLSNVSLQKSATDVVGMEFDLTAHVRMEENAQSDVVRQVLRQALAAPNPLGDRLKAVSFAPQVFSRDVEQALISAMHRDRHAAVRLKALESLSSMQPTPRLREAFLTTLREDESVQMRLQAVEYLSRGQTDSLQLRDAVEGSPLDSNTAVLVHLAQLEKSQGGTVRSSSKSWRKRE